MRIAYADPPYPGQSKKHYSDHPDYAGEVDHAELVTMLGMYDGWVLHTSSPSLAAVLALCPLDVRVGAWVKPFASFKPNVPVAYAWEPVIFKPARTSSDRTIATVRDWVSCPITLRKGLAGVKPQAVCEWAFRIVGAEPGDYFHDMYPGSGAVQSAWDAWCAQTTIPLENLRA